MERGNFGSKLGAVLASAGSAVGLGNIWRFPTEAGNNGGAAFIIIYLCCVFLLAMPVMISEFVIGRASRSNAVGSYRVLAPGKPWVVTGTMGVLAGFLVLSFYSVVAGWTLNYTCQSFVGSLMQDMDFGAYFQSFSTNTWRPIAFLVIFLLLTHFIVANGVEKGIEKYNKIMMPMLFIIIIILVFFSMTMPGCKAGLTFLFKPDFSKVTTKVMLSAMGQAFFTLSVGISTLATYASYFTKETKLIPSAINVCVIDTLVAICAGLIIFPAVFSVPGVEADAGPGLVFITLPNVFNIAFGEVPVINYIFSGLFYVLLVLAALTSSISMHEICTAYIHESFHLSRKKAAAIVTAICIVLSIFCSLSFGPWQDVKIMGMGFFELFDFLTAKFFMPLGGILICTFVGWYMNQRMVLRELGMENVPEKGIVKVGWKMMILLWVIRFIAPIGIGIVFVYQLMS